MHKRDREILARVATVNRDCGEIVIHLLTLQPDDDEYASGLRQLGEAFVHLGTELDLRASELDGRVIDAGESGDP